MCCGLQEQLRKLEGRQARAGAAAASEVETALTTVSFGGFFPIIAQCRRFVQNWPATDAA